MKVIRFLAAFILMPLSFVMVYEFFNLVLEVGKNTTEKILPFWVGFILYFVFQIVFAKPIRTYVFGHELTHAIFGILSGARLKKFKVSARGGSVALTKTNVLITLAPYFVPIYTAILAVSYWLAGVFYPVDRFYPYFLFGVGFTLAFHFSLTYYALQQGQSDMERFGVFFSIVFIMLVNCIFLALFLKLLFPDLVHVNRYFKTSIAETYTVWKIIYMKAVELCCFLKTK